MLTQLRFSSVHLLLRLVGFVSWIIVMMSNTVEHQKNMKTHYFKRLFMSLVNSLRECCFHRELHSFEMEWKIRRTDRNTENQNIFASCYSVHTYCADNLSLQG